jgi:site-specific recombinase XerD
MKMVEDWVHWLSIDHSPATVQSYLWEIMKLEKSFAGVNIGELSTSDLLGYLANRKNADGRKAEKVGDATIKRTVNALRSFYTFIGSKAAATLPIPRPKKRLQRTLTFEQAGAVLAACDTSTLIGKRDLAMIALMLDTGLRAGEICRLTVDKVNLEKGMCRVVVKGGTEEYGFFSAETSNYLSAWLTVRQDLATCPMVFVSFELHRIGQPLTPDGLRCLFRRIAPKAGLKEFSPHDLRRTFATLLARLGAPTRRAMIWGRWHDLKLYEQYTQALITPDAEDFAQFSPVAGILRRGRF